MTKRRIREFYEHFQSKVYVSFSGGKDSTVLLHIARSLYPDMPAVFCDTGLEFPEVRAFVRSTPNVIWIKPDMPFNQVIKVYGYPVVGKKVARMVRDLQNPSERNAGSRRLYLEGIKLDGTKTVDFKMSQKWRYLIDAPFKISEQCCDVMKKNPFKKYEKENGVHPILAVMANESKQRMFNYLRSGCNTFESKRPESKPMSFWTDRDIWDYTKRYNVPYCEIYDMGYERTGCVFCSFGVQWDRSPNRFQLLKKTHPQLYDYCMNKLDMDRVLTFLKVEH